MKRTIWTAGLAAAMTLAMAAPGQAATWLKAETEHFVIYSDTGESATRNVANQLETYYAVADSFYVRLAQAHVETGKLTYDYFASIDEFNVVKPNLWNGFQNNAGCRDGTFSFWSKDVRASDSMSVFRFLNLNDRIANSYFQRDMPPWLSVGLSQYLMTAEINEGKVKVGGATDFEFDFFAPQGHTYSVSDKNKRVPFSEVIAADSSRLVNTNAAFRAESWVIVHYLLNTHALNVRLETYMSLYNGGMSSIDAWNKAFGIDPTVFDKVMTDYVNKGVPTTLYNLKPLSDSDITLTPLRSHDPVPLLSTAAQICPPASDGPRIVSQLQKAAKAAPDDTFTQRELARAQVLIGNPEEALAYLTAQTTSTASDWDADYLLGRIYLSRAQAGGADSAQNYAAALEWFGKAYKLKDDYPPLLYSFAKANAGRPGYPADNTLTAAETARDLAPTADYVVYLAELYARRGRIDDMKKVLGPVDPDGKRVYDAVTRRILDAVAAKAPADDIVALFSLYGNDPTALIK